MISPSKDYCGDERMAEYLRRSGSQRTLHEVYGLFHGCIAARRMVMPSQYFPLILGEGNEAFDSLEQVNELLGNLMSLWNCIAGWKPEAEPPVMPDVDQPDSIAGLKKRITQNDSLITYFVKGLDLGGTQESDLTGDAFDALKTLSEMQSILNQYSGLLETNERESEAKLQESCELIWKLEEAIGDCIARINFGLKPARMRLVEDMQRFGEIEDRAANDVGSAKIGRNKPCPCGSGRKYKKCCGLTH